MELERRPSGNELPQEWTDSLREMTKDDLVYELTNDCGEAADTNGIKWNIRVFMDTDSPAGRQRQSYFKVRKS